MGQVAGERAQPTWRASAHLERLDAPATVEPVGGPTVGTVRLGGAVWSARALHDGAVLDAGAPIVVVAVEGATAVVSPADPTPHDRP